MGFIIEIVAHLTGIVVEEIDGFADFGDGVAEGFTGFADQNADQRLHLIFHQHRRAFKDRRSLLRRGGKPDRRVIDCAGQRQFNLFRAGFTHVADDIFRLGRVNYRLQFPGNDRMFQRRQRLPFVQCAVQQRGGEGGQTMFVGQIQARGVAAAFAVQIARQRDLRMGQTGLTLLLSQFFHGADRVGNQLIQR